jgi:hypothetical protein
MSTPAGPAAYVSLSMNIYEDGQVTLQAFGCLMNPDGTLQVLSAGTQLSVEVPLVYGATAASIQEAIGAAIATGYGGSAPDVVLLPSF